MDWKTRIPALVLWLTLVLSSFGDGNAEQRVVCYYTNWSVYRPGTAKFSPQNINPYLCTHLIYAFGGFTKDNKLKPFDKYQDIEKGGYAKFTGLKTYNKNLKTMLAIGGWNEASSRFSPMVADPGRRKEFVKNSVKFLRQNHFDGLDLDWEYPAYRDGGKPRDKNNYADFVQELREEFERESSKTGRPRLLLTMAVPAGIEHIEKGYDLPRLNDYLDFINLLSYDYHSAFEPAVNHHSPLYPLEEDNEYNYDTELTIDYTIEHLLKNGVSSEKIVLGIPTYGRSYTLFNEDATDIGSPADGPGEEGDATREKGYLAYYEICESIGKSDEWEVVQPNPSAMGPYAVRGNQWVGYDDEDIVRAKARYVNEKKLGGIMFWSIDNDDFRGNCHGRPYPLIEAAKEAMLADDEKSLSGTKTKLSDNRKKTRPTRIQSNAIGRKLNSGNRRSTTTESTRRRISTSKYKGRSNGRINGRGSDNNNNDNDDDEENEEEEEEDNAVKTVEKPRPRTRSKTRSRNRLVAGGRRKQQQNSRRNDIEKKTDLSGEESSSKKFTTPEPPTTPDPGSDFKCEDEGFFSHPRDCKKYFWCLDSGPGGLGVVAHQFTCPSGLVFNKAADSCDYPRNVVCPKSKTSQGGVTTTRAPITAATSRTTYLHKSTQRTTTEKIDSDEEYEYYDDEEIDDVDEIEEEKRRSTTSKPLQYKTINRSRTTTTSAPSTTTTEAKLATSTTRSYKTTTERNPSFEDEEDPRVIKELIDLIKKAGGIEQLEKQLHYQEKNSGGNSGTTEENGRSTPATISRSLYERVLNRQATRTAGGFLGSFSTTQSSKSEKNEQGGGKNSRVGFINGPGGAQFEGLDNIPEVKTLRRTNKPQYVTIERHRQSTSESPSEDDEEIEDELDEDNTDVASSEDRAVSNPPQQKNSNRRVTPNYVNIRRPRPSTTTSENDVELKDEDANSADSEEDEEEEEPVTQRHRVINNEEESAGPKSRYTNVQRFRSTTSRNNEDDLSSHESSKNDSTTSTTTDATIERIVPVTEKIEDSSVESTTLPSSTTSESSSTEKTAQSLTTMREESILEESSTASIVESTSDDSSVRLVENSATEILFTTAPASSLSTGINNSDTFTRGPTSSAVSQPRPFGFPRRGRPTTSTSTTASSSSSSSSSVGSVTEQTRSKVSTETFRLPTLKELVGFTTTPSNHDSTLAFNRSSTMTTTTTTTTSFVDTTIDTKAIHDEPDDRGNFENQLDRKNLIFPYMKMNLSDSEDFLEPSREGEIFDNDILGSEEIQRRSSSGSFVNDERQFPRSTNDENEDNSKSEKSLGRVEVPVKILDDTNVEAIAKLVLLRLPESKLNSAILKPIFKVKIIESDGNDTRDDYERNFDEKFVGNSGESSLENELLINLRSTSGKRRKIHLPILNGTAEESSENRVTKKNRPRNRQRIIKARRRTRLDSSNRETLKNLEDETTAGIQGIERISKIRENFEKSITTPTTIIPEVLENFSTTVRVTTIRGNFSTTLKSSNESRGFYVTRGNDETSSIRNSIVMDSVNSTDYSTVRRNETFDYSTLEIDSTTPEMDFTTEKMNFTTEKIDFTTQIDETGEPLEKMDFTDEKSLSYEGTTEITTRVTNGLDSTGDVEFTTVKLETVTPDFITTIIDDQLTKSFDPLITMIEEKIIDDPAITTFRPWTMSQVATTNPTSTIETTFESPPDGSTEITDKSIILEAEETTKNILETLETSENNEGRFSTIFQPKDTTIPIKTIVDEDNLKNEFQTNIFDVENTTEPVEILSDENKSKIKFERKIFDIENTSETVKYFSKSTTEGVKNYSDEFDSETKSQREKSKIESSSVVMRRKFDRNDEKTISQTEKYSRRKTNRDEKATTYRGVLNRGRARFTASPDKIKIVVSSSGTRNQTRKSTKSYQIDDDGNNLTSTKKFNTTSSTEAYDKTLKSTTSGEVNYLSTNLPEITENRSQNSSSTSRMPNYVRKTKKNFETASDSSPKNELNSEIVTSTESYEKMIRNTASSEGNYLTTNFEERTENYLQDSKKSSRDRNDVRKTTKSLETGETGSSSLAKKELTLDNVSFTEDYEKTIPQSTATFEADYLTTNFEEETKVPLSNSRSFEVDEFANNLSSQKELLIKNTATESLEKIEEQTTAKVDYLTTNFVVTTGSEFLTSQNFDPIFSTTKSFENDDSTSDAMMEKELTGKSIEINDKNFNHESTFAQMDNPTTNFIESRDFYTTPIIDKIDSTVMTTENYDKITEMMSSLNTIVTDEIEREEDNQTESIMMNETTVSYSEIPSSSINFQQEKINIDDRKNKSINISSDATTYIELESLPSTTSSYLSADHDEIIIDDSSTKINYQTVSDSTETIQGIMETTSPREDENYHGKKTNKEFYSTTLASTIYQKLKETTKIADTNIEKILTTPRELISKSVNILNEIKSTTPINEKKSYTKIDSSKKFVTPIIESQTKRTRGRVRFTNFAANIDEQSGKNRKPVKQLVVRRRLANDRHRQNVTNSGTILGKSENDENKSTKKSGNHLKDRYRQNVTSSEINVKNVKNETKFENIKKSRNNLNVRAPEEKINSSKSMRRRVVVYRGRPRGQLIVTTPSTTTTTVQSSSVSNSDEDETRKKRKWRKRIVRKRAKIDDNEDDQSIAETGDFIRALIDEKVIGEFNDELGGAWLNVPDTLEIVNSTEPKDINGEVNLYKSSGAFLRRPGTLVRTDGFNRSRSKSPVNSSVPAILPVSQTPIFSRIKSVDPTDEVKMDDQSVRAQELAVTLADPPAIRSSSTIGRLGLRKAGVTRKISTTVAPRSESATTARTTPISRRRQSRPNPKIVETPVVVRPRRPAIIDYDYYVDEEVRLVLKPELKDKLFVTRKGGIRCLDQGNFAHPTSCKKFITCARMVNGQVIGTEYTCPDKLSFDPVGGICNWSAGLGCEEKSNLSN